MSEFPDILGVSKEAWYAIVNLLKSDNGSHHEKLSSKTDCVDFLLDSGAPHHMTGDLALLSDVHDIPQSVIVLPNSKLTFATKGGTFFLDNTMKLKRVFFVPDLSCTRISLARLLRELDYFAMFTGKFCVIYDHTSKMLSGVGEERNEVYHFRGAVSVSASMVKQDNINNLWHIRLGHPSKKVLSSLLPSLGDFDKISSDQTYFCDVCIRAKQTRAKFSESINKADEYFSLIHCDVWNPYKVASSCGSHYFLTIVDDHSRVVWTYLMLAKSEVASLI